MKSVKAAGRDGGDGSLLSRALGSARRAVQGRDAAIPCPPLHSAEDRRVLQQYPDLELILCSSDNVEDIIQEGFDCVIRTGRIEDSTTTVARPLARYRWMVLASPAARGPAGRRHRRTAPASGGGLPESPYRADHRLAFLPR